MGIKKWLKNQATAFVLATSKVENNLLGQSGESLESDVNQERRLKEGTLADSLINGVVTEEVKDLRWRTYKILRETENYKTIITGYDEDDMPIVEVTKIEIGETLKNIKLDPSDDYPIEYVINNDEITMGIIDAFEAMGITINKLDEEVKRKNIPLLNFLASNKTNRPLKINREFTPKFKLEDYITKFNVRTISNDKKLIEFFISQYPKDDSITSNIFIKELEKKYENKSISAIYDISEIETITYKSIGVSDFKLFKYKILSFDKITLFNGSYLLKYIAEPIIIGEDIFEKHKRIELDEKYLKKEKK